MKKIKEIIFVNESGSDEGIKEAEKYVKKAVKTAAGFFKFSDYMHALFIRINFNCVRFSRD